MVDKAEMRISSRSKVSAIEKESCSAIDDKDKSQMTRPEIREFSRR